MAKRKPAVVKLHPGPAIGHFATARRHEVFPLRIVRNEGQLKRQRRRRGAQCFGGERDTIQPGHPDDMVSARCDGNVWQFPRIWLGFAVRQPKLGQAQYLAASVVKFQPVAAAALIIQRTASVRGEQPVDPQRMRRNRRLGFSMGGDRKSEKQEKWDFLEHKLDLRTANLA